jgi:hypothetical protein
MESQRPWGWLLCDLRWVENTNEFMSHCTTGRIGQTYMVASLAIALVLALEGDLFFDAAICWAISKTFDAEAFGVELSWPSETWRDDRGS